MNRKEKNALKSIISAFVDLNNGHFTDDEISLLYKLVMNREKLNGKAKTTKTLPTKGFDLDDTYWSTTETTYTFRDTNDGIGIEKLQKEHYDDGSDKTETTLFKTARDILNNIYRVVLPKQIDD